ncbi:MAG: hypothetical protein RLO08_17250 [Parvibaculaceae bacterium]|jgi:hypothetical protein|uniref:Uncharacterized protein n=1 Tax=Hyphomonas chukchiensis TaxID=1280947 RepID=A0A062UHB4_9PROT|nr:hypothetical protein HY30_17635 [Hyphomonas chukchiensis]|tara:strand:- start:4594 stop:4737 length:144 start_codon:yes stop_codon:yes gene_type:complete
MESKTIPERLLETLCAVAQRAQTLILKSTLHSTPIARRRGRLFRIFS